MNLMTGGNDLLHEDLVVLIEALDAWIEKELNLFMIHTIQDAIMCKMENQEEAEDFAHSKDKELERLRKDIEGRREIATLIKAKLIYQKRIARTGFNFN
jgi:hypothetical protein